MPSVARPFRLRPRSVRWAARYLGVSEDHVRNAIKAGELKFVDLSGAGRSASPIQGQPYRTTLAFLDDYILKRSRVLSQGSSRPLSVPPSQVIRLMEECS